MAKKIKIDKSKIVKRAPTVSTVQAVIFAKGWDRKSAKAWLKKNEFKVLTDKSGKNKVTETKNKGSFKYTIVNADDFTELSFKSTRQGISFVLGIKPGLKKPIKVKDVKEVDK